MDLRQLKYIANKTIRKNFDDLRALATGAYPDFVYRNLNAPSRDQIAVFTFHRMQPDLFESQLKYLAENHYKTLTSDQFYQCLTGAIPVPERAVVLTFDDCWGSLWAVAHPLLKKYSLNGIAFAISDVMEESDSVGPTLDEVWLGQRSLEEITQREVAQPLCNWQEIRAMCQAGTLEFQSHSRKHNSVFVGDEIVDFINPQRYPSFMFSDFNPLINLGDREVMEWEMGQPCFGEPVYAFEASYATPYRFIPDAKVGQACRDYVHDQGGARFFSRPDWRDRLNSVAQHAKQSTESAGSHKGYQQRLEELVDDLEQSRQQIEQKLDNGVDQICLPWYKGADIAVEAANAAGYKACHWGILNNSTINKVGGDPFRIRRINDEYLFALPGQGRKSLASIMLSKYWAIFKRRANLRY